MFKLDPGDPTIVVAWTVRYVVDPVMVTSEVIVLGAPFGPVVGIVVVKTSVTGAVTVVDMVVVAVTSSVDAWSSAIDEAPEGEPVSPAFATPEVKADDVDSAGCTLVEVAAAGTEVVAAAEDAILLGA